jgi:hypothetical protein
MKPGLIGKIAGARRAGYPKKELAKTFLLLGVDALD